MSKKILLIDDDSEFLTALQMNLEAEGYSVASAKNSVNGWKEMERFQPDILLVDWEMPEMSGVELVKLIKGEPDHQARYIIMVTGRTGVKNIVQGLDAGADDFLNKPFQMEELMARVRSGLRIRSLEKRITEEVKRLTILEMALSVADKVGNPLAAAKLYHHSLMNNTALARLTESYESLKLIGQLLDEALLLIGKFQAIKTPHSVPAPSGGTMIAPE